MARDINKTIQYLTLAEKQNHSFAQLSLGEIYLNGLYIPKNINKAIRYLSLAAEQNVNEARFLLGVIYSKGETIPKDIDKSISYYKYASSMNHSAAKNNLAMIYWHEIGIEKNEEKNKYYAIELLKEAIKLNDPLSMYNLAHIYFYEKELAIEDNKIETIIDLLLKLSHHVISVIDLLSIILIKSLKTVTFDSIENEIKSIANIDNKQLYKLSKEIYKTIVLNELDNPIIYDYCYQKNKNIDYIYDYDGKIVITSSLNNEIMKEISKTCKNIDESFYEGFGVLFN